MVNSKHSVKLKSTPKKGLRSSSRNMNDSQATSTTSGTNEDEKSFNETVEKIFLKETMKENHFSILLERLPERNLKFTTVKSKN